MSNTVEDAYNALRKALDVYVEAADGPSGDAEHDAANDLAAAAGLVLELASDSPA
jgi:hypothetical protein